MTATATSTTNINNINHANSDDDPVITMMEDDAYLMSMVDTDSLLPSNMTFGGMFEAAAVGGESIHQGGQLNAEELTDIASLLAPQVSDDETGGSGGSVASSSGSNTPSTFSGPVLTTAANAGSQADAPRLPEMISSSSPKPAGATQIKRASTSTKAPPAKKTKLSPSASKTKAAASGAATKGKANGTKTATATVAPKLVHKATPNPLSNTITKKTAPQTKPGVKLSSANSSGVVSAVVNAIVTEATKTATANAMTSTTTQDEVTCSATDANTTAGGSSTVDEHRAQQCRDRNRQHARNTRLRKKAYVEELKKNLQDLVQERDAIALEERQKQKILEQQREVRFQVVQDFLQLRGRNEGNPHRWAAIFEEGMTLTLPMTRFQSMVPAASLSTTTPTAQVLHGVTDIMTDSTFFASFLQSLGDNSNETTDDTDASEAVSPVTFDYKCERANFLMDDIHAILNWTAQSSGAVRQGARRELELGGSVRARFCAQTNRLEKVELQFDTGVVDSQLRQL